MLKNVIAPMQAWLLSQGRCVGCGMPLEKATVSKSGKDSEKITCKCKRVYMRDLKTKKYRRALLSEA